MSDPETPSENLRRRVSDAVLPITEPMERLGWILSGRLNLLLLVGFISALMLVVIMWILMLASYQKFGYAIDPHTYAAVTTIAAIFSTCALGVFVWSWVHHERHP